MGEHETLCGCTIIMKGGFHGIDYCPKHTAADAMYEALKTVRDGYYPEYWEDAVKAALALADEEASDG